MIGGSSYYGMKATAHLFDEGKVENTFKVIFVVFTVIGAAAALGSVIDFPDSMIFLMGVFNIFGLFFLAQVIRTTISSYYSRIQSGLASAGVADCDRSQLLCG